MSAPTADRARPFGSLLVANRGEVAVRVVRSARAAGLRTVAVWSDADRDAPHVRAADVAVRLGPAPAAESYLSVPALLAACATTGAEAVHPGYGFLAENAGFARAVEAAGLTFVGPPAQVIETMGRKDRARALAERADVPVVPSYPLPRADPTVPAPKAAVTVGSAGESEATAAGGENVTYPLLVKAAAGGGGKGMRVVRDPADLPAATAAARREAAAAFGDDTLLLERFVEHGRHVEVQVLADTYGTVLHLHERDCSVQRRHQKVLEEAPAPTSSAALRDQLCAAAVALAREVGYVGAGTVEFLVAGEEFFFLEMNTRLQVEHPVTEAVTGLDVVRMQLDVAAGLPLSLTQDDVRVQGHAIEARVYAEDAYAGFLPQAGRTEIVRWPERARVDHALESGQQVTTAYDPMLGKVVVHAATREAARQRLVAALDDTAVLGLTTNVGFLRALAAGDEFRTADIDTGRLDREDLPEPDVTPHRLLAAWTVGTVLAMTADDSDPFRPDGWRLGAAAAPLRVELDRPVLVDRGAGLVDGVPVVEHSAAQHVLVATVGGERLQGVVNVQPASVEVVHQGHRVVFTRPDRLADTAADTGDDEVVAPMPGTVLEVHVSPGDTVGAGQPLGVLEAMKMEIALVAPFAGTVARVGAGTGDQVPLGHLMFHVDPLPDDLSAE